MKYKNEKDGKRGGGDTMKKYIKFRLKKLFFGKEDYNSSDDYSRCGCRHGGEIVNGRSRNHLTLWTVPILVHVRVWVHILGDPQSVQMRNATTTQAKCVCVCVCVSVCVCGCVCACVCVCVI